MTRPANPCTVLTTLGYTEREAAFLRMVAMHSGVFLTRQYLAYTGAGYGKAVHGFIAKLVTKRHGRPIAYGDNQTLYHLTNKRIYRVLGIEDSNNRRARSDATLKTRLMALDFVLAHADARWLETEAEKIAFFSQEFGARPGHLPGKTYPSRNGGARPCSRYFVEKFPIFIVQEGADLGSDANPEVAFSFIDDGQVTVSSFCSFLDRYAPLIGLIPRFRLFYVTDTPTKFGPAERQFAYRLAASGDPAGPDAARYGELMARWQEGKTNFSSDEFAELARLRRLYGSPESGGAHGNQQRRPTVPQAEATSDSALCAREASFIRFPLADGYRFLGECRGKRPDGEAASPVPSRDLSPEASPDALRQVPDTEEVADVFHPVAGQPATLEAVSPPAGNDPTTAGFGPKLRAKVPPDPGSG
ncbi:MAG: hypothetical protein ACRD2E_01170 [Terriglobales bacterium]